MPRAVFLLIVLAAFINTLAAEQTEATPEVALHLARAKQFIAEEKPDLAVKEYEAVVAISPGNVEAQGNLGVVMFLQNKCPQAVEHLDRALTLQPKLANLQAFLGVCQKREGRNEEAKRNLEASLSSVEQVKIRALIENSLLEIYYAEGDLQLASKTTEDLLKADPHNPDVLYMVYRIHMDIASRARDALTAIAPDSARNHQIMAEHFINLGDAPNAIIQYQRALGIDPNLPGINYELAEATIQDSLSATSLAKAKDLLAKSLIEDPRNSGAEARLGGIAMIENHPEMAKQYFSRALEIQPDQLDAMKGMADIAANQGDKEEAIKYLVRASQKDPMDEKLHYRLSRLYRELDRIGESDKELELFKKVRDLKKKSELVEQRKSSL